MLLRRISITWAALEIRGCWARRGCALRSSADRSTVRGVSLGRLNVAVIDTVAAGAAVHVLFRAAHAAQSADDSRRALDDPLPRQAAPIITAATIAVVETMATRRPIK